MGKGHHSAFPEEVTGPGGGRLAIVNLFWKSHLQTKSPSSAYWQKQYDSDLDSPKQHYNHFDDHHHQNDHPYHYDDDYHYDDNQS